MKFSCSVALFHSRFLISKKPSSWLDDLARDLSFLHDQDMSAKAEATALKQQGNKAFAEHDWLNAVKFYTEAIEKHEDPSFFCNRAQV